MSATGDRHPTLSVVTRGAVGKPKITDIDDLRARKLVMCGEHAEYLGKYESEHVFLVDEDGSLYVSATMPPERHGRMALHAKQQGLLTAARPLGTVITATPAVFASFVQEVLDRERTKAESAPGDEQRESTQRVRYFLDLAIDDGASDIHLEMKPGAVSRSVMHFRINGMLHKHSDLSADEAEKIIRVLFKNQDFAEGDWDASKACDEMFTLDRPDSTYTVRLNSVPTENGGCKLVARLRSQTDVSSIKDAGYTPQQVQRINRVRFFSAGMYLFCGPTNSGKSTSVVSLVVSMPPHKCVFELADPIEVNLGMPNVSHVPMNLSGEDSAEKVLGLIEATVRQDTDVLVLGEIRNMATIRAAQQMAEQGKLVISTLHTDSVVGVHSRLVGIGMPPDLLTLPNFLRGAVAQRLIPTLCRHCASTAPRIEEVGGDPRHVLEEQATEEHARILAMCRTMWPKHDTKIRYWNPVGCSQCRGGISGRTVVAEAMEVDAAVREIFASGNLNGLREHLIYKQGMTTIAQHALMKIASGLIDPQIVEERIERITPETLRWPRRRVAAPADQAPAAVAAGA